MACPVAKKLWAWSLLSLNLSKNFWWKNLVKHQKVSKYYENGSGLAPDIKAQWCSILDPTFHVTNSGLDNVISHPNNTFFVKENYPGFDLNSEFSDSNNEEQFDNENPNLIPGNNMSKN